ncbi:MAG TPA: potassium transporter Kup [Candidatus Binataceae bacterium]|nr:potassium transporter Kup [Candidatus Binataceae bacterium]
MNVDQEAARVATPAPGVTPERKELSARSLAALCVGALGVVYGDIGTSPLYALRQCFYEDSRITPSTANVLGLLSLIFWALIVVISIKYLTVVVRADNRGDGGIIALVALLSPRRENFRRPFLIGLGLFGAALLYGDGLITPAISVLSAIEGLETANPQLHPYVVPIACLILVVLFGFQKRGTGRVGATFGPLMLLWFATIAILGIAAIIRRPIVFAAVNPWYAVEFFRAGGVLGFRVLGAVFLVVTGGEALYADMGHFGIRPIRMAWWSIVLPALLLNYFGQGALILREGSNLTHPFFDLAPAWALYPMVILAACATVIASQAVISGAFSLTRQAINLGQWPRMTIMQTSSEEAGQVYIPGINSLFLLGAVGLVIGFGSSARLAGAYGVAVSSTMAITTVLLFFVAVERWRWRAAVAALVCAPFLLIDLAFFGANAFKIPEGGWFPLTVGLLGYVMMSTWKRGRELLRQRLSREVEPIEAFLGRLREQPIVRVPGTAIFLCGRSAGTPPMLLHHIERNQVLHAQVVLLHVSIGDAPRVPASERLSLKTLDQGFFQIDVHYGFMQSPNLPAALRLCEKFGLKFNLDEATYYLGRETLIASDKVPGMARWRERLFAFMSRNAAGATDFFNIPPENVVELGIQVEL